jgi:hypothetical protein
MASPPRIAVLLRGGLVCRRRSVDGDAGIGSTALVVWVTLVNLSTC